MDPSLVGSLALSAATLMAAGVAAWVSIRVSRRTRTNHGKTIGQHVEDAARAADEANVNAQLVQLQLEQYKAEQAATQQREHDLIARYVEDDAKAHAELRAMLVQVALDKEPPAQAG